MNKHERMYQQIERHGANLNAIFNTGIDNIKLCKKLRMLEVKAHHAATCLCNTNTLDKLLLTTTEPQTGNHKQATEEERDAFFEAILDKIDKILNFKKEGIPVFINYDPRGYALKIRSEWTAGYNSKAEKRIYTDFGGYGILAPEFDGSN
jgi:hypothetical protein